MITLTGQREISGCNVYRDDVDPFAFYIMPQSPRIALDDAGKPIFSVVWYRRDISQLSPDEMKNRLGGGILSCSVELSTTPQEMDDIKKGIAADPMLQERTGRAADKLLEALKISTVPVLDGTVGIAILAEDGTKPGEFVSSLVGAGRVSMTGRERASFMAKLTMEGVILLWQMMEKDLPSIRIGYDLRFNHRLNGVTMIVRCDAQKSFNAFQEQMHTLTEDASWSTRHSGNSTTYSYGSNSTDNARNRTFEVSRANETSSVDIIEEAGADAIKPEEIAQLTQMGNEMIKDFIAATFLEWKPGQDWKPDEEPPVKTELPTVDGKKYGHDSMSQYKFKARDESMQASLYFKFSQQAVMEGHLAPNDNLGNVLRGADPKGFRVQVDLQADFFRYTDVAVVCNVNFDDDPIALVTGHLEYHQDGPRGRIDEQKDVQFSKTAASQHFATYIAAPDKTTYSYSCDVIYKGTSDRYSFSGTDNKTILVLDVASLGVLRSDLQIGICDWDQIKQAEVQMWYDGGATRHEQRFVFDKDHQSARWLEAIAKPITQPYHYKITWIDKTDQRLETETQTTTSRTLVLDAPLVQQLEVTLLPAGDFGSGGLIKSIAVALKYVDEAHDYRIDHTEVINGDKDAKIWRVPLRDKNLRTFQVQQTIVYTGGGSRGTRELPWTSTEDPVVIVGDPYTFRVRILPYLLKGGPWSFGTLHLSFDDIDSDGHPLHFENDFELKDFATPQEWHILLGASDRHKYEYQLTLFRTADGSPQISSGTGEKEILVLVPPK